jgi:hypothetical protein
MVRWVPNPYGGELATELILDAEVISVLRTRRPQDVGLTTQRVLKRITTDEYFSPLIKRIKWRSLRYNRLLPVDWHSMAETILADLADEPRAYVALTGDYLGVSVELCLNCGQEIVREKVDGKRREVPKHSDTSFAAVSAGAARFESPRFTQAYLALLADLFEILGGDYGWADHIGVQHGNEMDRARQDFFEPWFITWANLFGPALVERFEREQLLSAPAYQVVELPEGSVLLTVAASPLEQLTPEAQTTIQDVTQHLGIRSPSERATAMERATSEGRQAAGEAAMKRRIEQAFRQAREATVAEMIRQAEGAVRGAQQFWNVSLDFSPASLATVDHIIATGFRPGEEAATIDTAVQAFGAYLGEVVRRQLGGVWHDEEMQGQRVLLKVGSQQQRVEPFQVVRRRFAERTRPSGFTLVEWWKRQLD